MIEQWMNERTFWYERASRAHIRFEDAIEREDKRAAEVAVRQFRLYKRRYDAVSVPEDVRKKWKEKDEAERLAALGEQ